MPRSDAGLLGDNLRMDSSTGPREALTSPVVGEALVMAFFVPEEDLKSLVSIANYEADCTMTAQAKLCELLGHNQAKATKDCRDWNSLEFFRKAVHLSGEIYTAGDPTRTQLSDVASPDEI